MDPHEMMELMMQRKGSLKPYPFEKLTQNTAMFKQHETVDGLSFNMSLPLGNTFQLGSAWSLSNTKGANYEVTSSVNNHSGSPMMSQDDVQSMMFRFSSDQTGMAMANLSLPYKISMTSQHMFNDANCQEIMTVADLRRDFNDNSIGFRL